MHSNRYVVFSLPDKSLALGELPHMSQDVSPVIINWMMLRACIIAGAAKYLVNNSGGALGLRRANWAHRVANLIDEFDMTLMISLVIFGSPTSDKFFHWEIGRSSALAACVASYCISGEQEHTGYRDQTITLGSEVFSTEYLNRIAFTSSLGSWTFFVNQDDDSMGATSYFNKSKGVRVLLKDALDAMPREKADDIKNKVLYLKNIFENTAYENQTDQEIIERIRQQVR